MAIPSPRIIHSLQRLNDLQSKRPAAWVMGLTENERQLAIEHARMGIPHSILSHHELLVSSGVRSLAEVRHGTCGTCHMKLSASHRPPASPMDGIDVCDHCGVFLVWPEVASSGAKPAPVSVKTKPHKIISNGASNKHSRT